MKTQIQDLAVFGGAPAFPARLHVNAPNQGDRSRLMARIERILDTNVLTNNGPLVQEFEQRVAEICGVPHAIAVCNATLGLQLLLRALDLTGEVAVPSFTFVATAHAVAWQNLTPLFCDVEPARHTLDPASVAARITERTSAILAVHLWGNVCDVSSLQSLADERGIPLLFDAAHAFYSAQNGVRVGGFGEAEVFSFHATKFINSFEGGAITTRNDALAERLRRMRSFGISGYDEVACVGTNAKMSEVSAAMGLTMLERMDDLLQINRANHDAYAHYLSGLPGIRLLRFDGQTASNHQYVVLDIEDVSTTEASTRDNLMKVLQTEGVLARRYFSPGCHRMTPYLAQEAYPLYQTESLSRRVLVLPNGSTIQPEDIGRICSIIRLYWENQDRIDNKLNPAGSITARISPKDKLLIGMD